MITSPLPLQHNARNVIWLADTNYRIDLDNERVRTLAQIDDFDALLAADQVRESLLPGQAIELTWHS